MVTVTALTDSVIASRDTQTGTAHRVSNAYTVEPLLYDHSQNHIGVVIKVLLFYNIYTPIHMYLHTAIMFYCTVCMCF